MICVCFPHGIGLMGEWRDSNDWMVLLLLLLLLLCMYVCVYIQHFTKSRMPLVTYVT